MYRKAEKEKMKGGGGDGEIEMLLNEIPYVTSMNHLQNHLMMNASSSSSSPPVGSSVSQYSSSTSFSGGFSSSFSPPVGSMSSRQSQSQYSPSSSFSGGFCSSDDISPNPTPFEDYTTTHHQSPNAPYLNRLCVESKSVPDSSGLRVNNANDKYMLYEQALSENFYRMNIRDEQKGCANITQFQGYPDGFAFGNHSFIPCNVEKYDPSQGLNNGGLDFGGFPLSFHKVPMSCDVNVESALLQLRPECKAGNSMRSSVTHYQSNALYSDPSYTQSQMYHLLEQRKQHRGVQLHNPSSVTGPYINDPQFCPQKCGLAYAADRSVLPPLNSSVLMHPKQALNVGNPLYNGSMIKGRTMSIPNCEVPQSFVPMKGRANLEGFSCEDSFIIQENSLNHVSNKGCDRSKGQKKNSCNGIVTRTPRTKSLELDNRTQSEVIYENGASTTNYSVFPLQPNRSLADIRGYIYFIAKDQDGCRFLQRLFDEGCRQDLQIIFNEIIDHVVELMTNPFGNYLVQKLFDVCNEEQRTQITHMVTAVPGELVKISLNTHGTRSVQKLIETLNTRQQISLVTSALAPGFLDLIKDLNGNHVVQRCLQSFSNEHNKLIFDAATKFCADIATHRHGCCVLQKCVAHSSGRFRDKLVAEISANALRLAQDPFGNYVVQYIIEMKTTSANAILNSQFEGNYAYLSMQKFSSHVVEKCLRFIEESRSKIISELMSVSHFEQMLQDPFANYVIQSALEVTKGHLHALLVEAVKPHTILRTSPYCKRIFSRNMLRK